MQTPTPYSPFDPTGENTQYEKLLDVVRARFSALVKDDTPLFTVGTKNLFEAFLSGLPEARRQHYRCNECAHFFRRFGNLVTIDSTGNTHDLWPDADVPPFFRSAVNKVRSKVQSARVSGVFVWPETVWGTPTSLVASPPFEWHHLYVCAPAGRVFKALATEPYKAIQEARARRAELAEDHRVLTRACNEFRLDTIVTTKAILTSAKAFRGGKVPGVAEAQSVAVVPESYCSASACSAGSACTVMFSASAPMRSVTPCTSSLMPFIAAAVSVVINWPATPASSIRPPMPLSASSCKVPSNSRPARPKSCIS